MKGIVIIPAWKRPDFLGACIEYIKRADGWDDYTYLISLDWRHDPLCKVVAESFSNARIVTRPRHGCNGNSFNLFEAYREAVEIAKEKNIEFIHLIEEDIFIGKTYFTFHQRAWAKDPGAFFVSACLNQNIKEKQLEDSGIIYQSQTYQSLGVSLPVESVQEILSQITPYYYPNMIKFCLKNWPNSILNKSCVEQDGVIHRIIEAGNYYGLFPSIGRAFHAGFWGYNRPGTKLPNSLPLERKIELLMGMTDQEFNTRAKVHKDIQRCPVEVNEPDNYSLWPILN